MISRRVQGAISNPGDQGGLECRHRTREAIRIRPLANQIRIDYGNVGYIRSTPRGESADELVTYKRPHSRFSGRSARGQARRIRPDGRATSSAPGPGPLEYARSRLSPCRQRPSLVSSDEAGHRRGTTAHHRLRRDAIHGNPRPTNSTIFRKSWHCSRACADRWPESLSGLARRRLVTHLRAYRAGIDDTRGDAPSRGRAHTASRPPRS